MAFFSHTRTHTRTWQMTEWYVWQLWEVSEILAHGISLSHTHTHGHDKWQNDISDNYEKFQFQRCFTDTGSWLSSSLTHMYMTDDRMICLTIVRSFRSATRILAHAISLSHKHGHGRWQNIYLRVVRSFRAVTRILAYGSCLAHLVLRHCIFGAFHQTPNVNCLNYLNIVVYKKNHVPV